MQPLPWLQRLTAVLLLSDALLLGKWLHHSYSVQGMLHPPRLEVGLQDVQQARALLGDVQTLNLRSAVDGVLLQAWYVPPRNGVVVVLVHGGGANRMQFLPEAAAMVRLGMGVLLYDARASGGSGGALQTWGDLERADLRSVIDALSHRPGVVPGRIGVFGFSIGATTAALEAAQDPRVGAVALQAVWPSLEAELRSKAGWPTAIGFPWLLHDFQRAGIRVEQIRPLDAVARLAPRPLLVIAGEADEDTPAEVSRTVFEAAGMPRAFWSWPGVAHQADRGPQASVHARQLADFFLTHLLS